MEPNNLYDMYIHIESGYGNLGLCNVRITTYELQNGSFGNTDQKLQNYFRKWYYSKAITPLTVLAEGSDNI